MVDPHKHGLQPYGCGCVLFRDPSVGALYKHDSPYTYFTSSELHLGEISLECSRPGASAVALWATQRLLPLVRGGEFAAGLGGLPGSGRQPGGAARRRFPMARAVSPGAGYCRLGASRGVRPTTFPSCHSASSTQPPSAVCTSRWFVCPSGIFPRSATSSNPEESLLCLRSVLMKPEHREWVEQILAILDAAWQDATGK